MLAYELIKKRYYWFTISEAFSPTYIRELSEITLTEACMIRTN